MSTYTQTYYHIVFSTKGRQQSLIKSKRDALFRYIWGIIENNKCHLYRLNGVEDHLHIFSSLHQTVCLSDLVKDIKVSTSKWIKDNNLFPDFTHWQVGYGAFTLSINQKDTLIEYIKNQEDHHKKISFQDEFRSLLNEAGIEFDEKYLL